MAASGGSRDAAPDGETGPELADLARLGRRLVRKAVTAARAEDAPVRKLLREHLGAGAGSLPVVSAAWPGYDHVNVQAGLSAWLAGPGRGHQLVGLTGFRHQVFGLGDLLQAGSDAYGVRVGSIALDTMPTGPDGQTMACVQCAVYLIEAGGAPVAVLLRGPDERTGIDGVTLEACAAEQETAQRVLDGIADQVVRHNVFRGQVITFGGEVFGRGRGQSVPAAVPGAPAGGPGRRDPAARRPGRHRAACPRHRPAGRPPERQRPAPQAGGPAARRARHGQDAHHPVPARAAAADDGRHRVRHLAALDRPGVLGGADAAAVRGGGRGR